MLDLWQNGIGAIGGSALAKALQSNYALLTLEMRGNSIGDEGAKAFVAMMPRNMVLSTLDLLDNGITTTGSTELKMGLQKAQARPYLLLYEDGMPHQQWTSWQQKGQREAP